MDRMAENLYDLMIAMATTRRIKEGFKGQHLVVVPAVIRRRFERHPLLQGLFVTDAGFFPHASWHHVERPQGSATTLVILCLAGRGWLRVEGRETVVHAGEVVWLTAQAAHAYGADPDEPWTIEWAHMTGAEVPAWAKFLGLAAPGGVLAVGTAGAAELRFGRVWQSLERGYTMQNLVAAGAACREVLARLAGRRDLDSARLARERVAATIDWMKANLARAARLEELASLAGMSASHYSAVFRAQHGFPPGDFFLRLRIQRACQLLATTAAPIRAVAAETGFSDPFYFTRYFRRVMGCSPREYRKAPAG